jgi:hypothetical protein
MTSKINLNSKPASKPNFFKSPLTILILILIAIVLNQLNNLYISINTSDREVINLISSSLETQHDLVTVSMSTKATVKVSQNQTLVDRINIGQENLIYEGVGMVQAGIDLTQLSTKNIDKQHQKIHLILPPAKLINVFLNVEDSKVIDRYSQWFAPNGKNLEDDAQEQALKLIKAEACNKKILQAATNNAKEQIKGILVKAGYEKIIIETQSTDDVSVGCGANTNK